MKTGALKQLKSLSFGKKELPLPLALRKSKGGRPIKQKKGGRPKKSVEPKKMTLEDIMNLSPSKPVPRIIEQCFTHVVNIKIKQSMLPNQTIQLPTKGPQVKQILVQNVHLFSNSSKYSHTKIMLHITLV